MSKNLFAGIGGHHSAKAKTTDWLTPPAIIDALGGAETFDLDPCASDGQPWRTALACFTRADNGLLKPWHGRVWCNPPYTDDEVGKWLARMANHGNGTALIFARTETDAFFRHVWERAHGLLFLRGRLNFHHPVTGIRAAKNGGAPSVLCAYGRTDAEVLAYCGIEGQFVPLIIDTAVVVELPPGDKSWGELVREMCADAGTVTIADLYRKLADHPKARGNNHVRAKIRQELQRGPFNRVSRGQWALAV
jgi:phage N-6-adenine-methyltransferase